MRRFARGIPAWSFPISIRWGGGIHADLLFLLEKPGPKTSRAGGGSGLISVNNDDATAENSCRFLDAAGIDQVRTCHWNVIPGWDRAIAYRAADRQAGLPHLFDLLPLLTRVAVIVLVGNVAHRAEAPLRMAGHRVVRSAHPSVKVRNMNRGLWDAIPGQWAAAARLADDLQGALLTGS